MGSSDRIGFTINLVFTIMLSSLDQQFRSLSLPSGFVVLAYHQAS